MQDIQKIEGKIICNVDSASDEEISLVISNLKETILHGLILDLDGSVENSLMTGNKSLKIDFLIPNNNNFRVCHYSFPSIDQPPILGSYQRKQLSENCFRIRVKIDIEKNFCRFIKNLKIQLRVDPQKAIASTDLLANEGTVDIIGNRVLLWSIQSKIPRDFIKIARPC
jgi:Adaptor complexes medium subunit family.